MSASPHELWLASAGTGKTYRLTGHYLRRLLLGDEPARILATTFTRKAAGEILERVLARLLAGTQEREAFEELRALVPDREPPLEPQDGVDLLLRVLRELDRFRILTLDAFFLQLAQSLTLELDLPLGWRIADEVEESELKREAACRFIAGFASGERHAELVELLRDLQQEGASRRVFQSVMDVIDDGRAPFLESTDDAFERPDVLPDPDAEEQALELRAMLLELPVPKTQKGAPNKVWSQHVAGLGEDVARANWKAVLESGMVQGCLEDEPRFSRHAIEADWLEVLRPLRELAARALLADVRRRNEATREMLARFESDFRAVKRERAVVRFEDLPRWLTNASGPEAALDIDYLIDGRLDHVLLDEFQDTAPGQWRILERLCEEILSDGTGTRSFFCVGDVKQSIYGWRSAEPRLLAGLSERYAGTLEPQSMVASYRSSPVVLDGIHRILQGIDESPVLQDEDRAPYARAATDFLAGYEHHVAAGKVADRPGAMRVFEAEPKSEEDGEEDLQPALRRVVERVVAHRRAHPGAEIAILLRTNKWIARLQSALAEAGIPASGEGGNPLTDAAAVLHSLSLLQLADHPGDRAADFHVRHSPWLAALGFAPDLHRTDLSRQLRRRLLGEGFGRFFAALLPVVEKEPSYGTWDARRFGQLVDLAFAYDARATRRIDAFAEFLRQTKVEDPASAGVQVMTIHASKGLDFDVVILPQLDEGLSPRAGRVIHERPDPRGPITAASVHPGKDILSSDEGLRQLYERHLERSFGESLCLLYVAMTRAKRHLELILRAKGPSKSKGSSRLPLTFASLVRAALDLEGVEPDADGHLWSQEGSLEVAPAPAAEAEATAEPIADSSEPRLRFTTAAAPRRLERHAPTERAQGVREPVLRGQDLFAGDARARRLGTLIHRLFEEVEWVEDFEATDESLKAIAAEIEPDAALRDEALRRFRTALEDADTRSQLSRLTHSDGLFSQVEVLREFPYALVLADADGSERLWRGAIDRIVLERAGDEVLAAHVFDFKTGPEDARSKKRHKAQLDAYREAVAASFGLDASHVQASLLFV